MLAALLCWLDIRSSGGRLLLRLEDLDPERCRPEYAAAMERSLAWLGLDWDRCERQSEARERHEDALDRLAASGRLYPCACTRADLRSEGQGAADGGFRYTGKCRIRALPDGGWRESQDPLRLRLDEGRIELRDESGQDLSQDPVEALGDPIVRRRDGAMAYALAAIVDDAAAGVTRVVRGRDLAVTTATQNAMRAFLGLAIPIHRHHFLLMEPRGDKLAKLHGSVSIDELSARHDGGQLCALLAKMAGLVGQAEDVGPAEKIERVFPDELRSAFRWDRVRRDDLAISWDGERLAFESGD